MGSARSGKASRAGLLDVTKGWREYMAARDATYRELGLTKPEDWTDRQRAIAMTGMYAQDCVPATGRGSTPSED